MSQLTLVQFAPGSVATPSSANLTQYAGLDKVVKSKDSTGFIRSYSNNFSTTSQAPAAATRTYITGSTVALAAAGALQIGSMFRWRFNITKTGAGTATSTIDIAFGTAGTTADTAQVSFTKPAGTAVIDEGFVEIDAICRGPISASGIVTAECIISHNLATTGHMAQQVFVASVQSSAFNVLTPTFVGLCITTGAADAITIQQVQTEAWNI